jgi:nucleoside-diphosphate-sugar epimerase
MKPTNPSDKRIRVLITGGSGFLGRSILHEILDGSSPLAAGEIRVLDLNPVRGIDDPRISYIRGDVQNAELVRECCEGIDLVIHSAAIVDWGTRPEHEVLSVNVEGTRNVVAASLSTGVKALVYTSSLDVLHDGNPLVDVNEEHPYPQKHSTSYCVSKYEAERLVIAANGETLGTCSIRPADIYGEGDPYHIGSLIQMARKGFYVRLGNGRARCQHAYVGNVAHAHLLAGSALLNGSGAVAGQAYFITDGPGSNFFTFFDRIVEGAGYRIWPRDLWIPRWLAFSLGSVSEFFAFLWRPIKKYSPKMSRFAVIYTCTDYTFNSGKAKRDLGFVPKYSEQEAFDRTVRFFRNGSPESRNGSP